MKRVFLKNGLFLVTVVVSIALFSSHSFAEWETNDDFPLIGDPNAQKGGLLRYPILTYPSSFRVHGPGTASAYVRMMTGLVYESLIGVHSNTLEFIPGLAEAWEIKEDKKTFLFRLNPKARWEDGKPVTPEDVVFSYELVTDPKTKDPYSADLYTRVFEKPEIVDERTVKFVAKDVDWRSFLYCGGSLVILPAHTFRGKDYLKDFNWKMPNGSGPYKLWKFRKGNNVILKRRDDYWAKDERGSEGVNNFDQIKFIVVRDRNLMFEKFKKGEFDLYPIYVAKEWVKDMNFDKIQKGWIQKRKIYTFQPYGFQGIGINMRRSPFDDVRVRKALAHLYNRPFFMEKLLFNQYVYMDSYYANTMYENPNNEKIEYNPEKARKLLAEAGWSERNERGILVKDGQEFSVTVLYNQKSTERFLTIFQEDLKKAGIELKLKLVDFSTRIKLTEERNFDMVSVRWGGLLFPNPEHVWHSRTADVQGTHNIVGLKQPRIDEILEKYPEMFDLKERIAAIQEIDGLIHKEHPYILDWTVPYSRVAYWNRFGMPESYTTKFGDYDDMLSLWWYDEEKEKALKEAMKSDTALPVGETEVKYWLEKEDK